MAGSLESWVNKERGDGTDLASGTLADETGAVLGKAVVVEAETFDVGMRRHA